MKTYSSVTLHGRMGAIRDSKNAKNYATFERGEWFGGSAISDSTIEYVTLCSGFQAVAITSSRYVEWIAKIHRRTIPSIISRSAESFPLCFYRATERETVSSSNFG